MLRLEKHKFYSVAKEWRNGNLLRKSTSQPDSGRDYIYIYIYIWVGVKGKDLERVRVIFMSYLRTGVWFGPRT